MPAQADVGVLVSASAANVAYGQAETFTVTVTTSGTAPTQALLFDGAQELGTVTLTDSGDGYTYTGTLTTSSLGAGSHLIEAAFDGTDTQSPAFTSDLSITVTPDSVLAAALTVGVDRTQVYPGEIVTLSANLAAPGNATGTVNFYDNGTLIGSATVDANGIAQLWVIDLGTGTHNITAEYTGDTNFADSLASATSYQQLTM
jgi:hypothetical protein